MAIECSGCSSGHIANATVLLEEFAKFYYKDKDLAYLHLNKAIGNIRQAEEQQPDKKIQEEVRHIRKKIEGIVAEKGGGHLVNEMKEIVEDLSEVGVEALEFLEEHPETCPTCMSMLKDGEHKLYGEQEGMKKSVQV